MRRAAVVVVACYLAGVLISVVLLLLTVAGTTEVEFNAIATAAERSAAWDAGAGDEIWINRVFLSAGMDVVEVHVDGEPTRYLQRAGWPLRFVEAEVQGTEQRHGIPTGRDVDLMMRLTPGQRAGLSGGVERLVPMRPTWPAAFVAPGLNGGLLLVVWTTWWLVVRARRWLHGRCVGCGYARREVGACPECGRGSARH